MEITVNFTDVVFGVGIWLTFSFIIVVTAHATGQAFGFSWLRLLGRTLSGR